MRKKTPVSVQWPTETQNFTNKKAFRQSQSEKKKSMKVTKGVKLKPVLFRVSFSFVCLFPRFFLSPSERLRASSPPHVTEPGRTERSACVCVGGGGLCSRAVRAVYSLAHSSLSSLFLSTHMLWIPPISCEPIIFLSKLSAPKLSLSVSLSPHQPICLSLCCCMRPPPSLIHELSLFPCKTHSRLLTTGVVAVTMATALIDMA